MRIIIIGAGEVGFHVAKMLANEEHDIILVDLTEERLTHAESHLDVSTLKGNGVSIQILEQAGVKEADLLISATAQEETNITTAIMGKHLGAKRTIARISNPEFQIEKEKLDMKVLGIDAMVFPEDLAANEITRLVKLSTVTDSFEFGDGKLSLTGMIVEESAPIIGKTLIDTVKILPDIQFTVVAIHRGNQTLIPRGDTQFKNGDHIYFISQPTCIHHITELTGQSGIRIKNIMVLGGGLIGRLFAKKTQQDYQVRIIEMDKDKCFELADELPDSLIIHGDGSNVELLEEEGIEDMDAFIAVTGDSETNIISCLVARNHGVKRTIALVENMDYISLSQNIGIDTLINKKMIAINNIFRYVREGQVEAITSLHGVESEILEFIVHENCKITEVPIKKLNFPRDAIIAGIIRGEESFTASGDVHIRSGDRVVVFSLPNAIHRVEEFFK
ncbi:MAG: Trk system potassium transporter TrkA [Bacteroidota bacterium]